MTGGPQVRFDAVTKWFPGDGDEPFVAVQDVSLDLPAGGFTCIIGPSGCGKSTLLNMTAGLMAPTDGAVVYRGQALSGVNTDVGYMTQRDNLLPWRTVERNVQLALEVHGVPRRDRRARVAEILQLVGLDGFANRYPAQLSGGMQKRVSLARMLVYGPETLLMDEPFSALDAQLRLMLQRQLLDLWERDHKTVMFVTHDLDEALLLADQVVVFGARPGRIIHVEPIGFDRPRDLARLRSTPEFAEVRERLWQLLEPEKSDVLA